MLTQTFKTELNLLALHHTNPKRYPFLLESVTQSKLSHYSILFAFPQENIVFHHNTAGDFLERFDQAFQQEKRQQTSHLPFSGGWFVYLAYELAQQIEPVLRLPVDEYGLPIAQAVRVPAAIIVDHQAKQSHIVCEREYKTYFQQIENDIEDIQPLASHPNKILLQSLSEDHEDKYINDIATIREYIKAGDVFQVNYSRAWKAVTQDSLQASQIYSVLRQKNPAPFAALCDFGDWAIISSSPERLVSVKNNQIETRPIAGTRPRSESLQADKALLDELIAHPKERAEHIMLIDLERNDLGRICRPSTVEVNELMGLESYQHVHHIVSNIRGELQKDISPSQVIRAVFPGGTITGCPKVRCMEIIAELEQTGRGAYTGSVGYINHNGDMDFNILIRTMMQIGRDIVFRTGAGIVFDSIANNELEETRHKAKGLLKVFDY